jgi:hypothetical protein
MEAYRSTRLGLYQEDSLREELTMRRPFFSSFQEYFHQNHYVSCINFDWCLYSMDEKSALLIGLIEEEEYYQAGAPCRQ